MTMKMTMVLGTSLYEPSNDKILKENKKAQRYNVKPWVQRVVPAPAKGSTSPEVSVINVEGGCGALV